MPWARHLAQSRNDELVILLPQRKKGQTRMVNLPAVAAADEPELVSAARDAVRTSLPTHEDSSGADALTASALSEQSTVAERQATEVDSELTSADSGILPRPTAVRLVQILGEEWSAGIAGHLAILRPSLIVAPAPEISKGARSEKDWQTQLLAEVDCEAILIQDDAHSFEEKLRVAVFLSDDSDNEISLKCVSQLISTVGGTATAVFVEPNVGDFAPLVGKRQLDKLLRSTLSREQRECFTTRVLIATDPAEAFGQLETADFDLLLLGTAGIREMRKFLKTSPVGNEATSIPAVAVVRRGESFSNRLRSKVDRWIRSFVPQLAREERIDLVSRIQSSSQWDFDFVFLISLSTLIACLGLAENSGAVIVGAMLVAPLMTPIVGIGLGVAHANSFLTKVALRTALHGFATAILIGILFGLCVQGASALEWLPPLQTATESQGDKNAFTALFPQQMESRMRPQFYDLLIALASGSAAAYALGRPNLFSALPGVAIAAALVPPIATSGIAFSHGDISKAVGALLLFVTNMVVIILGTSLIFRAVGIRSQKGGAAAARWPRYTLMLLVLLSILVTVMIEVQSRTGL